MPFSSCLKVLLRLDHSLANVEESVFLVAVGKVTPGLEGVNVKEASTSIAVDIVATALEVVDVIVAILEVVVNKVATVLEDIVGQDAWTQRGVRSECLMGMSAHFGCQS